MEDTPTRHQIKHEADSLDGYQLPDLPDVPRLARMCLKFGSAALSISKSIHDIATSLEDDADSAASPLRDTLLEIRARLVFSFDDLSFNLISTSTHLFSRAERIISAQLQHEQPLTTTGALLEMIASMRKCCALNRRLLEETLLQWDDSFYPSFSQYHHPRARSLHGSGSSFWRALSGFNGSPTASSSSTKTSGESPPSGSHVHDDFMRMLEALEDIDNFWQASQELFANPDPSFDRAQLVAFQESNALHSHAFMQFMDSLSQTELDLSGPRPCITGSPRLLGDDARWRRGWKALLP